MLRHLRKAYEASPDSFRRLARFLPARVVYGASYSAARELLGDIGREAQFAMLRETCRYAYEHCPFWRHHFEQDGFTPYDFDFEAFQDLPTITSDTLKEHHAEMVSDEATSLNSYLTSTGGTGRRPTPIRLSNKSFGREWAFMHYLWNHVSYKRNDRKLVLRGQDLGNRPYAWNYVYNDLRLNLFCYQDAPLSDILSQIRHFRPRFIHGYPSAVVAFMWYLLEHGIESNWPLKGLLLGSEELKEQDKRELSKYFGAPVYSWYGQTEKVCLAGFCEHRDSYHIMPGYSYVEVLDHEGNPANEGEIVGTSFLNESMPLIRYRTGDYARLSLHGCICGWNAPVFEEVRGRWGEDFVIDNGKGLISTTALNLHGELPALLRKYQLCQNAIGHLEVRYWPYPSAPANVGRMIVDQLKGKVRHCKVESTEVTATGIEKTARGKEPMLVQSPELVRIVEELRTQRSTQTSGRET